MLISAKEIINKSLELFKRDFRIWVFYLIFSLLIAFLSLLFAFNPSVLLFFYTLGISPSVVLMLTMVCFLVITVLNIWFNIALAKTIHSRLFNQSVPSLFVQMGQVRHLLSKTIAISLLVSLIVSLPLIISVVGLTITGFEDLIVGNIKGSLALYLFFGVLGLYGIVHVFYFSIKYVFSYYLVVIDEKHVGESLHIGQKMVSGKMGKIFWRLFAPIILFLLVYVCSNSIFVALAKSLGAITIVFRIANFLSLAVSAIVAILCMISMVILFEDAKAKTGDNAVK